MAVIGRFFGGFGSFLSQVHVALHFNTPWKKSHSSSSYASKTTSPKVDTFPDGSRFENQDQSLRQGLQTTTEDDESTGITRFRRKHSVAIND